MPMPKKVEDPSSGLVALQKRMASSLKPIIESQERLAAVLKPLSEQQKRLADALKPVSEQQERLAALFKPVLERREQLAASFKPLLDAQLRGIARPPWFDAALNASKQFAHFNEKITKLHAPAVSQFSDLAKQIAELERQDRLLEQAGFLPHHTTPFHLLPDNSAQTDDLSSLIEGFYRDKWLSIRESIEKRIHSLNLDDEAKHAFDEGLTAHESGLYRATCRHLLTEIERITRVEIHDNSLAHITSQKRLVELAGSLSLVEVEPRGYFGFKLFKRLADHLYTKIQNDDDRKRLNADHVPNRHAAVHGLIVYRSYKNSLNTIFITDYVFQVIDALKRR